MCVPGSSLGGPVPGAEVALGVGETFCWMCGNRISGGREEGDPSWTLSGKVNFLEARSGGEGWLGRWGDARAPTLTFLAQQEGVEAQVIDSQVEPALPGHTALPVAAGVVVDQLLPLGHPELLPHLQLSFLELPGVLISLGLQVLVLFSYDALEENKGLVPGRPRVPTAKTGKGWHREARGFRWWHPGCWPTGHRLG